MNMADESSREVLTAEAGTLAILNKSEIDQQITTAHKYPRSIRHFRDECEAMVTLSESVAGDCIYAVPRDGKTIEGPSARFAEIVASAWGNCRAGARTIDEAGDFVTAQGVFHDLERNVAITYEVKRRITDRNGRRYKPDMIGVTANAACSIALRNAILKGVPKAFWSDMYDAARKVVMGDSKTLANRRAFALGVLQKFGATEEMVLRMLGHEGVEDITLEDLVTLRGIAVAIRDGDTTLEQAFSLKTAEPARLRDALKKKSAKPAPDAETATETERPSNPITYAEIAGMLNKAQSQEVLDQAADLIASLTDEAQKVELALLYDKLGEKIR